MSNSYVYVIGPEKGYLKVGIAINVTSRLAMLQTGSPVPLFIHTSVRVPSELSRQVEDYAHWILCEHRAEGEWFNAEPALATRAVNDAYAAVKKHNSKSSKHGTTMISMRVPYVFISDMDGLLVGGEGRSDFMRAAVMQELLRRSKRKKS